MQRSPALRTSGPPEYTASEGQRGGVAVRRFAQLALTFFCIALLPVCIALLLAPAVAHAAGTTTGIVRAHSNLDVYSYAPTETRLSQDHHRLDRPRRRPGGWFPAGGGDRLRAVLRRLGALRGPARHPAALRLQPVVRHHLRVLVQRRPALLLQRVAVHRRRSVSLDGRLQEDTRSAPTRESSTRPARRTPAPATSCCPPPRRRGTARSITGRGAPATSTRTGRTS